MTILHESAGASGAAAGQTPSGGAPSLEQAPDRWTAPTSLRTRTLNRASAALRALTTPALPSDYLDLFAPLHSGADLRGRIVAVQPETDQAATLLIKPGRGWVGHVSGQYIRIGVDIDGVRRWRAYSLTSGPRRDGLLSVTVKVIPGGVVSSHLVRHLQVGTVVQLDQATGDFHLPARVPARTLFVTAGSGITPVIGMLRHRGAELTDAVLVHSAPTPDQVIFADELRARAASGQFRLIGRHTDTEGQLTPAALADLVPDWAGRTVWACGPTGMLDELSSWWSERGDPQLLHTERFRPRILATGQGGQVDFTWTSTTVQADGATPLLDVGEAAGVLMPSGCRMGICFGCVAPLRSGAVRDLRNGAVTTAEPGDGVMVQTCVSAAAGPCQIEL